MRKRDKEETSPEGTSPGAAAVPMFVGMWSLLKRSIWSVVFTYLVMETLRVNYPKHRGNNRAPKWRFYHWLDLFRVSMLMRVHLRQKVSAWPSTSRWKHWDNFINCWLSQKKKINKNSPWGTIASFSSIKHYLSFELWIHQIFREDKIILKCGNNLLIPQRMLQITSLYGLF